ncbi:MAG: RNA-binding protein [Planctomycetes bacterium]|nr:RNA-binding protein [Planctomycetota bacterium]
MANRDLFESRVAQQPPRADARNEAGGRAYALTPHQALAQLAVTGCLNGTFYASDAEQLDAALELARAVAAAGDAEFVARTALWAREQASMKDMPALLLALLTVDHGALAAAVFDRVIDDGKMLRNFVQILRSGAVGRKSLGTRPKRLVREWLRKRSDRALIHASIGDRPSLGDILRMVHPKPDSPTRSALFAWLCDRPFVDADLPQELRDLSAWLADATRPLPDVPFHMLAGEWLDAAGWSALAKRATWQQTRMNLNTFARHGVFDDADATRAVAERLCDVAAIRTARAFPYQLMTALQRIDPTVPDEIRDALARAVEVATENVPALPGRVLVAVDVSGSMQSPITGRRRGATTVARCVDVAALMAATVLRRCPGTEVLAFHDHIEPVELSADDRVSATAQRLAGLPSGGTRCAAPLEAWNHARTRADVVLLISDNQSWVDAADGGAGTATMQAWLRFKARNQSAKLVCLDLQPYRTTQAASGRDVLNIGGFSDRVFDVIDAFVRGDGSADHAVDAIRAVAI